MFLESAWREGEYSVHEAIELAGLLLIGVAILGRMWCTLYIGGRKSQEIVAVGPYSLSRNPLYVFSTLAVAGVGLQTGSILVGAILVAAALAIFVPVIRREEAALTAHFGPDYAAYMARVPRFGPRFANWTEPKIVEASPKLLWRTLRDTLPLFLAFPFCEAVEWMQASGYLEPLLRLP